MSAPVRPDIRKRFREVVARALQRTEREMQGTSTPSDPSGASGAGGSGTSSMGAGISAAVGVGSRQKASLTEEAFRPPGNGRLT